MATYAVNLKLPPIKVPMVDLNNGLAAGEFYRWMGMVQLILNPSGSDTVFTQQGQVLQNKADIATLQGEQSSYALKATTITAGNGLTGSGTLGAPLTLAAVKSTGWTAGTGTGNKGAFAAYVGQTLGATYVQAAAQATDDAVKALAARVLSLEAALRSNGAIDG